MSRPALARRQAALVAALVAGGAIPPGFDQARVRAARDALLRKRAGEVAGTWPALRRHYGTQWTAAFGAFAADRPTRGKLRDGWDFARWTATRTRLSPDAAVELATREAAWRYDTNTAPRRRRAPAVRRTPAALVLQLAGHVSIIRTRRGRYR